MLELVLLGISALFGSGVLFEHKRSLTYIGLAGVLFELQLMATSFVARSYMPTYNLATLFLVAGILYTAFWVSQYKKWTSPYTTPGSGIRDAFVGLVLIIVIAGAYPIVKNNGFVGENFVLHGFYNGDVVTFASLIQKSFDTTALVSQNPFSGNGYLEYPTLLHGTFADFFTFIGIGNDWLHYLGLMTYAGIFLTVPLFFLLWDTVWPEPSHPAERWFGVPSRIYVYLLQAIITLFAIGISFDSFVYPQSHFFLMGLELALIAVFVRAAQLQGTRQIVLCIVGIMGAFLLLQANTVAGTVAAALAGTLALLRVFDKKRGVQERAVFFIVGIIIMNILSAVTDGRTQFNNPHISVSAAGEMLRAGFPALAVLFASICSLSRKQYSAVACILVALLGFGTFLLSDRAIVTENASRFLYHSLLIGFSLLLPFVIQVIYAIRRELLFTLRPIPEIIAGWIGIAGVLGILVLPVAISAGSTYLSMVKSTPYTVSLSDRALLWWIDEHTAPQDVVITSGDPPYTIPLFTGRAMLRAKDYWLSLDNDVATVLQQAYSGDTAAQQSVLKQGQFVILTKNEATLWNTTTLTKMFDDGSIAVYKI